MKFYYLLISLLICSVTCFAQTNMISFSIGTDKKIARENGNSAGVSVKSGTPINIIVRDKNTPRLKFDLLITQDDKKLGLSQDDFNNTNRSFKSNNELVLKKDASSIKLIQGDISFNFTIDGGDETEIDVPLNIELDSAALKKAKEEKIVKDKYTADSLEREIVLRPGITYYDARALASDTLLERQFIEIVAFYFGDTVNDIRKAIKVLNDDEILGKFKWKESQARRDPEAGNQAGGLKKLTSFVGNLGGLDVTNIANGIAQFMIKRAKEELTITFFNRFKEFVKKNEEFRVLFPKTTDNLQNLLAYKYPDMLPALRAGFFEDLKMILYRLDDVLELPKYQQLLRNFPEIRVAIRSIRLVHELEAGEADAATVLDKFGAFTEWKDTITTSIRFRNFGSSVRLAANFSHSLRNNPNISKDTTRSWISFKEMDRLVNSDTLFTIYFGLLRKLTQKEKIRFYSEGGQIWHFDSILLKQKDDVFLVQNKVKEFIELANRVDKTLDTLKDKKKKNIALNNDDYYAYIDLSLDVIDYGFLIAKLFDENIKTDEYVKIARKSNDLYRNIYKIEYTQAISNAMDILTSINDMVNSNKDILLSSLRKIDSTVAIYRKEFEDLTSADISTLKDVRSLTADSTIRKLVSKVIALDSSGTVFSKLPNVILRLTRYGLFIANLADAKTPDEVEAILDNAVLPVGSSSIKKNSCFNLAVQSYLGAFYRASDLKRANNNAWNSRFGVTAPIGIAASWGLKGKAGSFSLFGSLLDLGAIVDYQLKKDSVATPSGGSEEVIKKDYKVRLGQIFSPGAYAIYGFGGNIPVSFGVGAQYGPGLGKIENSGNLVENNPQWKFNIFLAVDIPFFNLVNTPKKYKPHP